MKKIDILVEELPKRGGWPKDSEHAWCDPDGEIRFRNGGYEPDFYPESDVDIECRVPNPNYEDELRYIITREQYEAALAAKNDGWIEWGGGECPVEKGTLVDVRYRNGEENHHVGADITFDDTGSNHDRNATYWENDGSLLDIIAYRLHQPKKSEQVRADACNAYAGIKEVNDEADLNECIGQAPVTTWSGEGLPPVGCVCERSWAGDEWLRCEILFISHQIVVVKLKESGIEDAYNIGDVAFRQARHERTEAEIRREEAVKAITLTGWCQSAAEEIYDLVAAGKVPGVKLEDRHE